MITGRSSPPSWPACPARCASGPEDRAPLPPVEITTLRVTADAAGPLLIAGTGTAFYRSRDGIAWQKLAVGSVPIAGQPAAAGGGVLFYAGMGQVGADGVWRSRNGGDSWELLARGLTDLRTNQPVLARGADEAYFVGRTGGIRAWRPAQGRWERIAGDESDTSASGALSLAPDGTLFLLSYESLQRSTDGGQTWRELPRPPESGQILGFSPAYTQTQTLYGQFDFAQPRLWRSGDGGLTWNVTAAPLPPYVFSTLLVADGDTIYLYQRSYDAGSATTRESALLLRSRDGGSHWETAAPAATAGTTAFAVAPDGRLWFGAKGSVRAAEAGRITWSEAQPAPAPTPPPALSPSP